MSDVQINARTRAFIDELGWVEFDPTPPDARGASEGRGGVTAEGGG